MAMNADVRAASTAKRKVDPRSEDWTRMAMRRHDPSRPPAAGVSRRREQQTIAIYTTSFSLQLLRRCRLHGWCRARDLSAAVVEALGGQGGGGRLWRGVRPHMNEEGLGERR
uniref:Uncharacterized protein n=1 Tax=Triticum urartu TaxID=4572 RepID=A0A8R7U890_TRIUA